MFSPEGKPERIIRVTTPVRICDIGGWTDTWFAEYGRIFNVAIEGGAKVAIEIFPRPSNYPKRGEIILHVKDFDNLSYVVDRDVVGAHPLLEGVIDRMNVPDDIFMVAHLESGVPPGSSVGSSASICTAFVIALAELSGRVMSREEIVSEALKVETVNLKGQSGIQDQICSVYGKVNLINMIRYPDLYTVTQTNIDPEILAEFQNRLLVVTLGRHDSSSIHRMVIDHLEQNEAEKMRLLEPLRIAADDAMKAFISGRFIDLGLAMIRNNEAQRILHPRLISPIADGMFDLAKEFKALGWKVNGAGGDGGSVSLLCDNDLSLKHGLIEELSEKFPGAKIFNQIKISPGYSVSSS